MRNSRTYIQQEQLAMQDAILTFSRCGVADVHVDRPPRTASSHQRHSVRANMFHVVPAIASSVHRRAGNYRVGGIYFVSSRSSTVINIVRRCSTADPVTHISYQHIGVSEGCFLSCSATEFVRRCLGCMDGMTKNGRHDSESYRIKSTSYNE